MSFALIFERNYIIAWKFKKRVIKSYKFYAHNYTMNQIKNLTTDASFRFLCRRLDIKYEITRADSETNVGIQNLANLEQHNCIELIRALLRFHKKRHKRQNNSTNL